MSGWAGSHQTLPARRAISWVMLVLMVGFIILQLDRIGWTQIWAARPRSPFFYVLVVVGYLVLPLADATIYHRFWAMPLWRSLPVFFRKRVFNSVLIGYSGELVLLMWAKQTLGRPSADIAHTIKDSNILSAVVSTFASAGMILFITLYLGTLPQLDTRVYYGACATIVLAIVAPFVLLRFRKVVRLSARDQIATLAIHSGRFIIGQVVILAQWQVALPAAGFASLATLLALQLVISRLPLMPSRDLLFIGAGISLSHSLALPQAEVASLLVVSNALQQLLHLLVLVVVSVRIPAGRKAGAARCG